MPEYDAAMTRWRVVNATPEVTYAAIRETDLLDPFVKGLFFLRELPQKLSARVHGEIWPEVPSRMTFNDLLEIEPRPAVLVENPGVTLIVGSVGRFWRRNYGGVRVSPADFVHFADPGYAKLVMGFHMRELTNGGSLLRYEARTATTNEAARRSFRLYWGLIRPGVAIVMGRALTLIRKEAERRAKSSRPRPGRPGRWTAMFD